MPLYEYLCQKCGHMYEKIQKFSDPLDTVCPKCGGPVKKKIAETSFQLKGGGWYKDGYASAKPETKDEGRGTKDDKPETEKKTEKKPGDPSKKTSG